MQSYREVHHVVAEGLDGQQQAAPSLHRFPAAYRLYNMRESSHYNDGDDQLAILKYLLLHKKLIEKRGVN